MKFMEVYPNVDEKFREARTLSFHADLGSHETVRNKQWYCYFSFLKTNSMLLLYII